MIDDFAQIDESLPPCTRFQEFIHSQCIMKLMHCTVCCVSCLLSCDLEFVKSVLLPSIKELVANPNDAVSESMLLNIPDFCEQLEKSFPDEFDEILLSDILPSIYDIINTYADYVGDAGAETLASVLTMVPPQEFLEREVPRLKDLLSSKQREVRAIVAQVLLFLVDYFDPDVWSKPLFEFIATLSGDTIGSMRAHVPQLITLYAKRVIDPEGRAQLCGRFALFAHDSATYVRKATAESLVAFASVLDDDSRELTVVPVVNALLNDRIKTVSSVCLKNLGPLISSIGKRTSADLVQKYGETLTSTDPALAYAAAFSFPAVALALGKERWPELSDCFKRVTTSREYRVRRTLAFGLVSFGFLMEPDELQSIAVVFLKDLPSIAVGIIGNLFQLIRMVTDKEALRFCLEDPFTKYRDWRVRLRVSEQLRYCMEDYDVEFLFSVARQLVLDDVAVVRRDAALSFANLMGEKDVPALQELADSESYIARLSAAHICRNVPIEKSELCIPVVEKLARDPVANVRIRTAEAVVEIAEYVRNNERLNNVLDGFENDTDVDVKQALEA